MERIMNMRDIEEAMVRALEAAGPELGLVLLAKVGGMYYFLSPYDQDTTATMMEEAAVMLRERVVH